MTIDRFDKILIAGYIPFVIVSIFLQMETQGIFGMYVAYKFNAIANNVILMVPWLIVMRVARKCNLHIVYITIGVIQALIMILIISIAFDLNYTTEWMIIWITLLMSVVFILSRTK